MNEYQTIHRIKTECAEKSASNSPNHYMTPLYEQLLDYQSFDNSTVVVKKKQFENESHGAKSRRMARNAERMRERRANESEEDYRKRLHRTASYNKNKRHSESDEDTLMRRLKDAARQRLRRAMETEEERKKRLAKLAERMRNIRACETPEQKANRLSNLAARARDRISNETPEQRTERLKKQLQYSKKYRRSNETDSSVNSSLVNSDDSSTIPETYLQQSITVELPSQPTITQPPTYHTIFLNHSQSQSMLDVNNMFVDVASNNSGKYSNQILNVPSYPVVSIVPTAPPAKQMTVSYPALPHPASQIITNNPTQPKRHANFYRHNADTLTNRTYDIQNSLIYGPNYQEILAKQQQNFQDNLSTSVSAANIKNSVSIQHQSPGRPRKLVHVTHPSQVACLSPEMKQEYEKQQKMSELLALEINKMLQSPRNARGRPSIGNESEEQRQNRLRKMAEKRREQRQNETPDERHVRLLQLMERARQRRAVVKATETELERRERLSKQAEYARERRELRIMVKKSKE